MTDHEKELRRLVKGAKGLISAIACEKVVDLNRFARIKLQKAGLEQKLISLQNGEKK